MRHVVVPSACIALVMDASDTILIVVDGYSSSRTNNYVLNITGTP